MPATPTNSQPRRRHREVLLAALAVIALSFLLVIRPDGRVAFRAAEHYAVPETCVAHALLGVDCPMCGLTRSFIELARGDWRASLGFHRLGWMVALAVLLQVPYRSACLFGGRSLGRAPAAAFACGLAAALLLNWVLLHARIG